MHTSSVAVSVVIPLKRTNAYLRESLEYLKQQTFPSFDVYVVTDDPEGFAVDGLDVHWLASGAVPPNIKRMMAARQSHADVIALLDDDAFPVPRWLSCAMPHFQNTDVVGVGGPAVTPVDDPPAQQASGAVYASALVSAGLVYRYLPSAMRDVDDYPSCNLLVRRLPFLQHVAQCTRYWPGEDTKLCLLLTRGKAARIVYDPHVLVYHHRRPLFWKHFRQVWNYAVHRGFFAKRYPDTSRRPAYFVPSAFLAANLAAIVGVLLIQRLRTPTAIAAAIYGVAVLSEAIRSLRWHRANPGIVAVGIYLTHLTYGVGFLLGLVRPELDH